MNKRTLALGLGLLILSGSLQADDDCDDPVADWQPRERLRQQLEAEGWTVFRIKVDDGCYEVKGRDPDGNRVEASYAPGSLELMDLEHEDDDDDDSAREGGDRGPAVDRGPASGGEPANRLIKARPKVTVE